MASVSSDNFYNMDVWHVMDDPHFILNVKQHLINANVKRQEDCIDLIRKVVTSLDDEERNQFVQKLAVGDVISLLCDSMATIDDFFLSKLMNCMLLLSENRSFYANGEHILMCTMNSTVRVMTMLSDFESSASVIEPALNLTFTILKGIENNTQIRKCIYNPDQMLLLVTRLLDSSLRYRLGFVVTSIFCYVLEDVDEVNHLDRLLLIGGTLTDMMTELLKAVNSDCNENCNFACLLIGLCDSIIRLTSNLKVKSLNAVQPFLNAAINTAIPYLTSNYKQISDSDYATMFKFVLKLCTIQLEYCIYSVTVKPFILGGFLDFLCSAYPRLREQDHLFRLISRALTEILCSYYSIELININSKWPDGAVDDFRMRISQGLKIAMKYDTDYWFSIYSKEIHQMWLHQPDAVYAIVLICYMLFLSNPLDRRLGIYMASISRYIEDSSVLLETPSEIFIKALWFTYATCWFRDNGDLSTAATVADEKLDRCLRRFSNLNDIYSHSPAILFWSFNAIKRKKLHFDVMILWLSMCKSKDDLTEDSSIMKLCRSNEDGRVILVNIITELGTKQELTVVNIACRLLYNLISDEEFLPSHASFPQIVWLALSNVLWFNVSKQFSSDSVVSTNARPEFNCTLPHTYKLVKNTTAANDVQLTILGLCEVLLKCQLKYSISYASWYSIEIDWGLVIFAISGDMNSDYCCRMMTNLLYMYLEDLNNQRNTERYIVSFPSDNNNNNFSTDVLRTIFICLISNTINDKDDQLVYTSFFCINELLNYSQRLLSRGECYADVLQHLLYQPAVTFAMDYFYNSVETDARKKSIYREMFKFSVTWLLIQKQHFTRIAKEVDCVEPFADDKTVDVVVKMIEKITDIYQSNILPDDEQLERLINVIKDLDLINPEIKKTLEVLTVA